MVVFFFLYRPCMIGPTAKKGPLDHVLRHCCIGIFLDSSVGRNRPSAGSAAYLVLLEAVPGGSGKSHVLLWIKVY